MIRTPWPSRSAPHHWIACQIDGQAEPLPGVDGEVGVLPLEVLERVQVAGGRVARLGARDVEPGDPLVAVAHDELGDLHGPRGVAHRGQQRAHPDQVAGRGRPALALAEALVDRLDDLGQAPAPSRRAARARSAPRRRRPRPAARSSAHSAATRRRASGVCMTPTVWANVSR